MRVELLSITPNTERIAGEAAAICTRSDDPDRSLRAAMGSGHDSVLEHISFTFRIDGVSRVLLAQLTRHRLASFSVESQRYSGAPDPAHNTVIPPSVVQHGYAGRVEHEMIRIAEMYLEMVANGVPEEDARYFMPQGIVTNLIMTVNARELGHILSLRCCRRAQWQIRDLADRMREIAIRECPSVFRLSGPGCLRGLCPEGKRTCGNPRTELLDESTM